MAKIDHVRLFLHALRTSLIFVSGFLIYEILVYLEKKWNLANPENKTYNYYKRNLYKLILIFIADLIILYGLVILFKRNF
jgi:hypothetical protein